MIKPPDELYATDEIALLLGVGVRSVQQRLKTGELTGVRVGRDWCIPAIAIWRLADIEAEMLAF